MILLGLGSVLMADFTRNESTAIVVDNTSRLQWQDNAVSDTMSWYAAVGYCDNLDLAGKRDWRLPAIGDLEMIVDAGRSEPAIIDSFQYTISKQYWSATTSSGENYRAIYMDFSFGKSGEENKDYAAYVRCVR